MKLLGEGIHTYPLPNPRILDFGLKLINCLSRDSFGCKAIPSCDCPGEKRALQTIRVCIRTVIRKGVGPSSPALPLWLQTGIYILSIITKLLWILQNRVREACCHLSCRVLSTNRYIGYYRIYEWRAKARMILC